MSSFKFIRKHALRRHILQRGNGIDARILHQVSSLSFIYN